jgi:hypothetical protein
MGAPDPLGVLMPHPRDAWSPLTRPGATGALTVVPIPADGMDVTVHSEHERGNRALTQHDPGHSTTTTSVPHQSWRRMSAGVDFIFSTKLERRNKTI